MAFNFHAFLVALSVVVLIIVILGGAFLVTAHRWWVVQVSGALVALLALAAIFGVLFAL